MKKLLTLTSSVVLLSALLVGCDNTSVEVNSIKIDESSINTSYTLGQEITDVYYNDLLITLNKSDNTTQNLLYRDNKNSIKITKPIETSKVGEFDFEVSYTYTLNDVETTLTDSIKYSVKEKTNTDDAIPTNWTYNVNYANYLSKKENASFENDGTSSFISNEGKFYIGNYNAVNLLPTINCIIPSTGSVSTLSELPDGVEISLESQDSTPDQLALDDYFTQDAIDNLKPTLSIKFKDELDASLPRDVTLVLKYTNSTDEDSFPELRYNITIVDGYNITDAKELILIDNYYSDENTLSMKKEVLNNDSLEDAKFSFENFVLFNDVSIELEDLPERVIYKSENYESLPKELNNTLKDWLWVYAHTPTSATGNCTIYGNYNHIALGETFPYILTESNSSTAPTLPDSSATAINSHTTLFGNPVSSPENCSYQFRFFDVSITGNQGVLETDQRNEETGLLEGGLLLTKFKNNLLFNNTVVNNFFTINVNDGPGGKDALGENGNQPTTSIKDSKMFDCFSTMLFNYSESKTEVEHSILSNSGGFLFLNQANPYGDSNNKTWYGTDPSKIKGTIINIDETTILDNYVTGQGGWFQIYGAQSAIASLKNLINPGFEKYGKTFTKAEGDYELFNAIALNMNSNMESAEPLGSGMVAQINIGDDISIDTTGDKEKVDSDYKTVDPSNPMTMLGFAQDLYKTEYGALYFAKLMTKGFLFKTHGTSDLYLAPASETQMTLSPVVNLISGAIKQTYPEYADILDTIITPVNDLKNYSDFKESKYLTIYIDISAATSIQSEAAPRASVNDLIKGYANFTGTNSYGLIVELLDN